MNFLHREKLMLLSLPELSQNHDSIGQQPIAMDHHPVVMNGRSSSWTIRQEVEVVLTFFRQYYVGYGVVVRVTSTNLLLVLIAVIEVSDAIKIPFPFPVNNVRHFS